MASFQFSLITQINYKSMKLLKSLNDKFGIQT